ncbi:GAF domain-containing protein [Paracoccus aestuariivivens]|uniref:GAF domain-containing protein n=1 Tax=Paracoccus aestuariivivens TaxID=1820333 RepID=A0A6L6JGV0_9RHOB|nr:GAF domain-containing protein [Paracoccus aestuariivivens]MTH79797.1 GAF domain-containing protein [Paracoccus aestuariivivens]
MDDLIDPMTDTFIRVAEVWVPEGDRLVHKSGVYGDLHAFEEASRLQSFAKGEGLPGKAWAEARPVVLNEFEGSYFKRTAAANEAGLTSAVAIPVFAGKSLMAVLVVLCGADQKHKGAIEVWRDNGSALVLDGGYYGGATEFETISRQTEFTYGRGLPGTVWASNTPMLMRELGWGYGFVRSAEAEGAGLKHGLGLPIPTPGKESFVLTLLSSQNTPIARRFEIWDARHNHARATRQAVLIDGICEREGSLASKQNPPVDAAVAVSWHGPVGQVLGSGLPYARFDDTGLPAGYRSIVALPIYRETDLAYVVAWYL